MKNRIKEFRQLSNLSQSVLGEMVGVSRQTINSLESGKYNPSITLAFKLSKVFGQAIEILFVYEEDGDE